MGVLGIFLCNEITLSGGQAPCCSQCCTAHSIGLTQSSGSTMNTSAGNLAAPGDVPVFIRSSAANTGSSLNDIIILSTAFRSRGGIGRDSIHA